MGPPPGAASTPGSTDGPRTCPRAILARLLTGCDIEALDVQQARSVGALAARAATTDIVDGCVVEGAIRRHDLIVSSDHGDLHAIAAAISARLEIDHP